MRNPILEVNFYSTEQGNEPVRGWLKSLSTFDKKRIGEDIKTVQFGWPLGMPLVKHLDGDIWEVRVNLSKSIARVLFVLNGGSMDLAKDRAKKLRRYS